MNTLFDYISHKISQEDIEIVYCKFISDDIILFVLCHLFIVSLENIKSLCGKKLDELGQISLNIKSTSKYIKNLQKQNFQFVNKIIDTIREKEREINNGNVILCFFLFIF